MDEYKYYCTALLPCKHYSNQHGRCCAETSKFNCKYKQDDYYAFINSKGEKFIIEKFIINKDVCIS